MGRNKLSDWITAATVVDSKGNIHKFEQKGHDVEMIKAIQASLGMFAIFISLTMKVQDQFFVRVDHLFQSLESFFFDPKHLRKFINQNSFVKMVWIPYNGMELEYLNPWHATVTGKFCWNPLSDKLWVKAINQYKRGSSELDLQQVRK